MATARPTVRTLDQILAEMGTVYEPQIQSLQTQIADLPTQVAAQKAGLEATQQQAFSDILSGARRRGTGIAFGGIPLGEQAQYTASTFLPAVANLETAQKQQAITLQDAINEINERKQAAAITQQQYEQQRADAYDTEQRQLEAARQAAAAQAAAAKAAADAQAKQLQQYLATVSRSGSSSSTSSASIPTATAVRNNAGDFAFYDANSNPITAGSYATQTGQDIRDVLYDMGTDGDVNAANIYNAVRFITDDATLNSTLNTLASKYPYILNGYVVSAPYAPVSGTTKTTTASVPSSTFTPATGLYSGLY